MPGEFALDTNMAIRYLNADSVVVAKVASLPTCEPCWVRVVLPLIVVGELLFGAENSARALKNVTRYLEFIDACSVTPMGRETAATYSQTRCALKRKGRPIPENDTWIAAQCLEHGWTLATDDGHFAHVDGLVVERW